MAPDPPAPEPVLRLWRHLAGRDDVLVEGTRSTVSGSRELCPPGWTGVLRLGTAFVVEVGDARPEAIERLLGLDDPSAPEQVAALLQPAETLGPGELAYLLDRSRLRDASPLDLRIEEVDADRAVPGLAGFPAEDVEEAGIDEMERVLVALADDEVVGAAGHVDWPTSVAHLGIVVAPSHRGRGIGTVLGAAATRRALAQRRLTQWRAASWNLASRALGRRLGFVEVGRQFSFRLTS